jgi:hypothetical protein
VLQLNKVTIVSSSLHGCKTLTITADQIRKNEAAGIQFRDGLQVKHFEIGDEMRKSEEN